MASELYRVNVNCEYVSTGAQALTKSDNRQGIAVVLDENSDVDNATPTVKKGANGSATEKDIYGVLLYIDEGTDRARVCSDGIVRMKATGTIAASDCGKGVILSTDTNASSAGKVEVAGDEKGNFKIVAVSGTDILVDLGSNVAVIV